MSESPTVAPRIILCVLGRFDLTIDSHAVPLPLSCQRLLTLLALRDGQASRPCAAGTLWPDATAPRANANLRSVLWKLQRGSSEVIQASSYDIRLALDVAVDIQAARAIGRRLLDRSATLDTDALRQALNCNLYDDIVPDLSDDEWLTAERERYRQFHLHALESLSEDLIAIGWHGAAVEAALGVTRIDPFRESAWQLLIRAYLAEGNQLEARRQLREYRTLLHRELGLEPTDSLLRLAEAPTDLSPSRGLQPSPGHRPPGTLRHQPVRVR